MDSSPAERVVQAALDSSKYREVSPEAIRRIALEALEEEKSLKDAIKATKGKLHQIAGAYVAGRMRYDEWRVEMEERARAGDGEGVKRVCREAMSRHASSTERAPILESFYATIFAQLPPVRSVLDIACGLNPLAIPWMPIEPGTEYFALDLYADLARFLNAIFPILGVSGEAVAGDALAMPPDRPDALAMPPDRPADLALLLKALPVFEMTRKSSAPAYLKALPAKHLLVSFPSRSLGGRDKGMRENYEKRFLEWVEGENWEIRRFEFKTELAFLIEKG